MNETEKILIENAKRYPLMKPQDAVKLLYQNEFGTGHFAPDEDSSRKRLTDEYEGCLHDRDIPLFECIGNGYVRCHINSREMRPELLFSLNRAFLLASERKEGTKERFEEKLAVLERIAKEGRMPFSFEELAVYLKQYRANGIPAVSHSQNYRDAYAPAYRVVEEWFAILFPLLMEAERLRREKGRIVIALEGRCAAGKTTACRYLTKLWKAETVHMDDFFLPPDLRTEERYREPGGNIHYERFCDEVLKGLTAGEKFSYRTFCCRRMGYDGVKEIAGDGVVIVEGVYSMHPSFGNPYDLTAFFDIDRKEQKRRILLRNGEEEYRKFEDTWIPLEEQYFAAYHICENCQLLIKYAEKYGI